MVNNGEVRRSREFIGRVERVHGFMVRLRVVEEGNKDNHGLDIIYSESLYYADQQGLKDPEIGDTFAVSFDLPGWSRHYRMLVRKKDLEDLPPVI